MQNAKMQKYKNIKTPAHSAGVFFGFILSSVFQKDLLQVVQ